MSFINGGQNNGRLSPGNKISPKQNKLLLVINAILFVGALVIAIVDLVYKNYMASFAMLLVMALTGGNAIACWKRMKEN